MLILQHNSVSETFHLFACDTKGLPCALHQHESPLDLGNSLSSHKLTSRPGTHAVAFVGAPVIAPADVSAVAARLGAAVVESEAVGLCSAGNALLLLVVGRLPWGRLQKYFAEQVLAPM